MTDDSFSSKLRNLSKDYYQNHIGFMEYRAVRRELLEQIDEEFNGQKITRQSPQQESEDNSIFMKTVAFFANTDLDDKEKSK